MNDDPSALADIQDATATSDRTVDVKIMLRGEDAGAVFVVRESCLLICDACGEDLFLHEWVDICRRVAISGCDRA